jgi:hypothetical protein
MARQLGDGRNGGLRGLFLALRRPLEATKAPHSCGVLWCDGDTVRGLGEGASACGSTPKKTSATPSCNPAAATAGCRTSTGKGGGPSYPTIRATVRRFRAWLRSCVGARPRRNPPSSIPLSRLERFTKRFPSGLSVDAPGRRQQPGCSAVLRRWSSRMRRPTSVRQEEPECRDYSGIGQPRCPVQRHACGERRALRRSVRGRPS